MEKIRAIVSQIQRKTGKTETESSPQAIYRADVVLVMLLIIEVVVGVRLRPPPLPLSLCVSFLLSPSLWWLWPTALYLPPQTSHLQRNYPWGRHQLALHSTAVGGGAQRREAGGRGGEGKGGGLKMSPSMCFLEIRGFRRGCLCPNDWEVNNRCYIWDARGDNLRRD